MGIYSTCQITRQEAEAKLKQAVAAIEKIDNDTLAHLLHIIYGEETLNNYSIVEKDQP